MSLAPEKRRREFVLAPLPMINPTLDNGLALVAGMLYPLSAGDTKSPQSASFLMGFRTSNGSWMSGALQTLHIDEDRYRATLGAAYLDINFDYFGIGSSAGDAGESVELNQAGGGGIAEFLVRVGGHWYAGPRYLLIRTTVNADFDQTKVSIPLQDIRLRIALLGPHVERDTRDDQFYPRSGTLLDGTALFASEAVGGQRTYQIYQAALSSYIGLGARQVLASRVNSCVAGDDAPFYGLCLLGQYHDLRGYPTGQYRDHAMLTGQSEYRLEVWKRLGLVLFGGLGGVADGFDKLSTDAILPSGGAGIRFRLTRQNHVNLRVDYAWGKKSNALYVSVAEAF